MKHIEVVAAVILNKNQYFSFLRTKIKWCCKRNLPLIKYASNDPEPVQICSVNTTFTYLCFYKKSKKWQEVLTK